MGSSFEEEGRSDCRSALAETSSSAAAAAATGPDTRGRQGQEARGRAIARARARTPNRSRRPSSDVRRRAARPGQEDHLKDEKVRLCARFGGEGVGRGLARRRSEVRCRDRGGVHRRVHRRARSGVRRPRGSLRASPKTPLPVAAASALLGACTHRQERHRRRAHGSARPTGARIRLSCSGSNASGHITPAHTRDRRRVARAFRQPRQLHGSRAGASRPRRAWLGVHCRGAARAQRG